MNDRALPLLPLGILLLLAGMTFWLSSYVENQGAEHVKNNRNDPDVMIEKFSAQKLSPSGDVQYVVTADKMTHYPRGDLAVLEKIVFTATTPGRPNIAARAPTGISKNGGDEIVMEGGVVIDAAATGRSPAMQLKTPTITILPEQNIARSVSGVAITSVQGVMKAASFELNNATQELKMSQFNARLKSGSRVENKAVKIE
ncbi:MAG: LPS export ABC transporter periplasmic protein LptC [Gammaproteobacteria bacterium]|nr:LPS export ABC transporter periplasmic protein LptC [Gammaproteobacteria bacterium]